MLDDSFDLKTPHSFNLEGMIFQFKFDKKEFASFIYGT